MNRLAGGVAGTALAGGEDKWYEDSAGLLSYNVLKTGKSGQREVCNCEQIVGNMGYIPTSG
jgi:hypothetical protein